MPTPNLQTAEEVTILGGSKVTIRPIRPDDAPRLQALVRRLSPESAYLRFLSPRRELPDDMARTLANVDYEKRMALVAEVKRDGQEDVIAVARYAVLAGEPHKAEFAIVVQDDYQGRGLGTLLMKRLVAYASARGIRRAVGQILSENERLFRFLDIVTDQIESRTYVGPEIRVEWNIENEGEPDASGTLS